MNHTYKRFLILLALIYLGSTNHSLAKELRFINNEPQLVDEFNAVKAKFLQIYSFLQNIELSNSTPLHREFFGEKLANGIYDRVMQQIETVGYIQTDKEASIAGAPFHRSPLIILTNNFPVSNDVDDFVLTFSVLLHEAWHIDLAGHSPAKHAVCQEGSLPEELSYLIGEKGCDDKLRGAYIVNVVMLDNISKYCTNCSNEIKLASEKLSKRLKQRVISKEVIDLLNEDLNF